MEKVIKKGFAFILAGILLPTLLFSQTQVTSIVEYQNTGNFVPGITVKLVTMNGTVLQTTTTNGSGMYTFNNVQDGTYKIVCSTTMTAQGINLSDAFMIQQHLQNGYPLDDMQKLAADVNGNGNIQNGDYQLVMNRISGNGNPPFPSGEWVFDEIIYTVGSQSREGVPFSRATSSGDVNGTYVPEKRAKSTEVSIFNPTVISAIPGEPIEVSVTASETIETAGMHLRIPIPEGLIITGIDSFTEDFIFKMLSDEITITWLDKTFEGITVQKGEPIITIKAVVKTDIRAEEELNWFFKSECHFIDASGELINHVDLSIPSIRISGDKKSEDISNKIYPHPFVDQVTFSYELPVEGSVSIKIYNSAGQQVAQLVDEYQYAGSHQAKFDAPGLMPGIYHYSIQLSGNSSYVKTGSMIKSK